MHEFKVGDRVMSARWKLGPGTIVAEPDKKRLIFGACFYVRLDDGEEGLFFSDEMELLA